MRELLVQSFILAAPLMLAATAGYLSERSGVINIALEGLMLAACAALALTAPRFGAIGGLACALGVSAALALLHWLATQVYRIDQIISGMVINGLAFGGTNFASLAFTPEGSSNGFPSVPKSVYYALALALPVLVHLYVQSTRGGLRLMASGASPEKSRLAGIDPVRVRLWALLASGIVAGLGGALLVTESQNFGDDMTAGRGYIALAALILGGWRPIPTLVVCLLFGASFAFRIAFGGQGGVPSEVWSMLPYLATVVALAGAVRRSRAPAGLGRV